MYNSLTLTVRGAMTMMVHLSHQVTWQKRFRECYFGYY